MNNRLILSCRMVVFLSLMTTGFAQAQSYSKGWSLEANAHLNKLSIDSDFSAPDVDPNYAIDLITAYYFSSWFALEAGLYFSTPATTESQGDIVGTHRSTINTQGLTFGVKPAWRINKNHELTLRLGVFYWDTELEVEESFGDDLNPGIDKASDNGVGSYMHIAWHYWFNKRWAFNTQLSTYQQNDVFGNQSDKPFDLNAKALTLGGVYKF